MPRMRGNIHVGNAQERSACHPGNLDAVAVLRCYVRDQSFERGAHRLSSIEPQHGSLDFSSHEDQGPPGFLNRLFEGGAIVLDSAHPFESDGLCSRSEGGKWAPSMTQMLPALIVSA